MHRNIYWWAALAGIIAAVLACCALLVAMGAWFFPFSPRPRAQVTPAQTELVVPVPLTETPTLIGIPLPPELGSPAPTNTPEPPTLTFTATPHPTNTPPPTPVPTLTPTYTPVPPTPTRLLNTPHGTVLNMGETWYADGVELRLAEAIFDSKGLNIGRSCYIVRFEMANRSTSPIYFAMDRNQFWITDNLGQRYEMQGKFHSNPFCTVTGYSPPIEVSIEPGKRFDYNWLDGGWNMQFFAPVTDPNIKSLTVHVVNLSRIANAEWQIQIR